MAGAAFETIVSRTTHRLQAVSGVQAVMYTNNDANVELIAGKLAFAHHCTYHEFHLGIIVGMHHGQP